MAIRTFYWDQSQKQTLRSRVRGGRREFRHGNAGDMFSIDLLRWAYPDQRLRNVTDGGRRLLLIGSVAHRIANGDLVNGVGVKASGIPGPSSARVTVRGVRGPLTAEAFRQAGHDTTNVLFMGDPGLLIGRVYPEVFEIGAERSRVVFIPHYRERSSVPQSARYSIVDIDSPPRSVAMNIRAAEAVLTSSLHGLIWAHALGRPARLVAPMTAESLIKYEDYLLSIGLPWTHPPTLDEALRMPIPDTLADVVAVIESISLPSVAELAAARIAGAPC
jgi:pyruvyltransferase